MEHLLSWAESLGLVPSIGEAADLLHIADDGVEFAIVQNHSLNIVEAATVGDPRIVLAAFETVDDACRLLAMQLGALLRFREGMPRIEAHKLSPGFIIEQAPTALWLTWFTGSAEFPMGERSRVRAVNFSRVERAPVEVIRSSFLDPTGFPLYTAA